MSYNITGKDCMKLTDASPSSGVKLSVIIPTRNRCEYLIHALATVLKQLTDASELVISDNHSTDNTAEFLATLLDHRVRVIRPAQPLAMVDHFDWVIDQARGDWITVLGDDDGLMPYFFDFVPDVIRRYGDKYSVIFGPRAYYFWPGVESLYGPTVVHFEASGLVNQIDSQAALSDLIFGNTSYFEQAQFYTGTIFSKELIRRIRLKHASGRIFNSITPDANSVVLILLNTTHILKIGTPLAWVGSSPKSNGVQSVQVTKSVGKDLGIFQDFKTLNSKSEVLLAKGFQDIYEVEGCSKVYLLESLFRVLEEFPYPTQFSREEFLPKHRMFLSIYLESKRRRRHGKSFAGYSRLFARNAINVPCLVVLHVVDLLLSVPQWLRRKAIKRFSQWFPRKERSLIYTCKSPNVHSTIGSINELLSSEPWRGDIKAQAVQILNS